MQLNSKSTATVGASVPAATARLFSIVGPLLLTLSITFPAHAALQRVGPVSNAPSIGGYPLWYQDKTGLALEFCDPLNASEVAGGWCLLLPLDVPTVPETFPSPFFDEHFYFAADSNLDAATGSKINLVIALEGAFATGPAIPGDQQVFTRIRFKMPTVPTTGTYRFIHPYGEDKIPAVAGDRIFFTEDVGVACAKGSFDCALNSRLGPFLLPSQTPGGAEIPPVTAANPTPDTNPANFGGAFAPTAYPLTGKAYIADPARSGPVTGSPLPPFTDSTGALRDHNIFRVEGPAGSNIGGPGIDFIETTNFSLQGRVFQGQIAGLVKVDRASYTAAVSGNKLDVFASGFTTAQTRMPASAQPAATVPTLSFYDAACVANATTGALSAPPAPAIETPMIADGSRFWAETHPAAIPAAVCVKDSSARDVNGNVVPAFFPKTVTDEVAVTKATYDPATQTLTVAGTSSDTLLPASLTLDPAQPLTGGQIVVSPLLVPTAKATLLSSASGSASLLVTTGSAPDATQPPPTNSLVAVNDVYTFAEDALPQVLPVLGNDTGVTGGSVAIVIGPRLGTAVVNADGTITYTPNLNANGTDSFTYQVTVGTASTNIANVALNITPVNDAPVAVDDGPFNVNVNVASPLPLSSLIANDTDVDGNTDVVAAVNFTQPTPAGASITTDAAGNVTFTATAEGTYTFTYQAKDAGGLVSANAATVTVNAIASDVVVVSSALFRTDQKRWVISGTGSAPNQTIHLTYVDGSAAGFEIGQATVTATGAWTLDIRGVTGNDDPTTLATRPTRIRGTSSLTGTGTVAIQYK